MLRLSFLFSACLHLLLLGVASMILSSRPEDDARLEKNIRINLQNTAFTRTKTSIPQAEANPLPPLQRPLPQSEKFFPSPPKLEKTHQRPSQDLSPPVRVRQPARKEPLLNVQRNVQPPPIQDVIMTARKLPTPEPTPVPTTTPVPRPSPTPIVTAVASPQSAQTPTVQPPPVADAEVPPRSSAAQADSGAIRPKPTQSQDEKRAAAENQQQQQRALRQYLQAVAAQINAAKRYPRRARRRGWEGTVEIRLRLLPSGEIEQAELIQKSPYTVLDEAALEAIEDAQPFPAFAPELTLRAITVNIPIQFTLGNP
ncbi:TonB family protein [candidate division KSB3 bacterium]|uniref:TonB family protein n=1 Tax=candidate division KSB3 bacterium TaxID=2044937 RepID=A0A9D5JY48_9BACT|nr:TonB family protein [candidate division KSB3 bacterium]MBD3326454.1 TonB family protein [candidate division KSB3 bacterium]